MAAQEELRWKVVHLVTIDTKIRATEQRVQTRSVSTKAWRVRAVDDQGNITFVHQVDSVNMWQNVGGRQEIRYNSETDKTPPAEYEQVAKSVGVPLATFTINPFGKVTHRESDHPHFDPPGMGELTLPLPDHPVPIGASWEIPDEVKVRLEDGRVPRVLTRQLYTLEKVEAGVATIKVKTEVLTPVTDPKIQSQLVQRLTHGTVKFDLDAGRVLSKQMDLDETVIGFNGADSLMQYLARFTEEYQSTPAADVAAKPSNPTSDTK
jgi:hypothetical protein